MRSFLPPSVCRNSSDFQYAFVQQGLGGEHDAGLGGGEGETALHPDGVWLAQGGVGGKLYGSAEIERARRHNDLIVVAGHIPRLRSDEGING